MKNRSIDDKLFIIMYWKKILDKIYKIDILYCIIYILMFVKIGFWI